MSKVIVPTNWGHHLLILNKLTDPDARLYYLRATAQLGWSRRVLLNQIKAKAYERAVTEKKTHNFSLALPELPRHSTKTNRASGRRCGLTAGPRFR